MTSSTKGVRSLPGRSTHVDEAEDLPEWFIEHLQRYPELSAEAERALLVRVADGDGPAKQLLIQHNLRLVMFVARRYVGVGLLGYDDLVQEGVIGLIKGIEHFQLKRGGKLSTYVTWWIRQAVTRAMMEKGRTIRLPVYLQTEKRRDQREQLPINRAPLSLDADMRDHVQQYHKEAQDGEALFLVDTVSDPDQDTDETAIENVDREQAGALLTALFNKAGITERDRQIMLARASRVSLEEIGRQHKICRERVRQVVSRCLARLQKAAGVRLPDDILSSFIA